MALVYESVEAWAPSAGHPHYLPIGQGEVVLLLLTWNGWADAQHLGNRNMERRWVPLRVLRSLDYTVQDADGLLRSPRYHQWLDVFRSGSVGLRADAPAFIPPPTAPQPAPPGRNRWQ